MRADTKALLQAAFLNVSALLGCVSTASTFFPVLGNYRPYLLGLGGVLIVIGVFRGGLKVAAKKNSEIESLLAAKTELENRIAQLEKDADDKKRRALADLASELQDDLKTAQHFFSGMPGGRTYVRPSVERWRQIRTDISAFLDANLVLEVRAAFDKIERWNSIVESGPNMDYGNPEIDTITADLKILLPTLIEKVKAVSSAETKTAGA